MNTTTTQSDILAALDESIAIIQAHRDLIAKLPAETLEGWGVCRGPMLSELLQLHSRTGNIDAAKDLAREIGTDWLDNRGGQWEGRSAANRAIKIILHGAYQATEDRRKVDL